jgi:hypothetical protein
MAVDPSRAARSFRLLPVAIVLALLGVRCAHSPRTPQERACKQRVDRCMERCEGEPTARDPNERASAGCDEDMRSRCEDNCYELCDW